MHLCYQWFILDEEKDCGCDNLHLLSLKDYLNYTIDKEEDYQDCMVKGGIMVVIQKLVDVLVNNNVEIKLSHQVSTVEWSNQGVKIGCENGAHFEAHHALITMSLACLKKKFNMFHPGLPQEKLEAIDCLKIGCVDKLFLVFDQPLPDPIVDGFCLLWEEDVVAKVRNNSRNHWFKSLNMFHEVNGNPRMLMSFITGEAARFMATLTQEQIFSTIQEEILDNVIIKYLQENSLPSLPKLTEVVASSWEKNRWIGGGYAFAPSHCLSPKACRSGLAQPLIDVNGIPRVLFSGEALSYDVYGTFYGAMATAKDAVDAIT